MSTSPEETRFQNEVYDFMIKSGMQDRISNHLKRQLQGGQWRDEVSKLCKQVIDTAGIDHIKFDQLLEHVQPRAKELVPDGVRQDTCQMIRSIIENQFNSDS